MLGFIGCRVEDGWLSKGKDDCKDNSLQEGSTSDLIIGLVGVRVSRSHWGALLAPWLRKPKSESQS